VLGEWNAGLRGAAPSAFMAGLFALYGNTTTTAADVLSSAAAINAPMGRFMLESSKAVIASAQGQFDTAEHHLSVLATVVRDHAVRHGEAACLIPLRQTGARPGKPPGRFPPPRRGQGERGPE